MGKIFLFVAFVFCLSVNAQTQQQWKDSISVLSKKIELNPKSLELRMRKAECNIALEQWQYALDEYSNILDLHPTHIGALYFRAFVNHVDLSDFHHKSYLFCPHKLRFVELPDLASLVQRARGCGYAGLISSIGYGNSSSFF